MLMASVSQLPSVNKSDRSSPLSNIAHRSAQDASLVETDRLFLRLLRHKFWLDSSLATVDRAVAMLREIADQADLGLGSRQGGAVYISLRNPLALACLLFLI